MASVAWREHTFTSADGLRLFARDYGPEAGKLLPVLCLSGLTRNSKDAHAVAVRLCEARRVLAPDYRGRGRSAYAQDWTTYRPDVELEDAIALLDRLGIERSVVFGTSRGGIVAMLMASRHKSRMAGVLLNDIGPELERAGLLRIRGYLGKAPHGENWEDTVAELKRSQSGFETLSESEWLAFAHRLYRDEPGRPALDYDPNLARAFPSEEQIEQGASAELWTLFEHLSGLPATVVRGERSDLLSEETVARMLAALPGLDAVTVPGRGHAPFLDEPESVAAIDRLLARCG
jgi:pimeloyl-ACP methyl ester carboxylesterase